MVLDMSATAPVSATTSPSQNPVIARDKDTLFEEACSILPSVVRTRYEDPKRKMDLMEALPHDVRLEHIWFAIASDLAGTLAYATPSEQRRFAALFVRACRLAWNKEDNNLETLYPTALSYYATNRNEEETAVFASPLQPNLLWLRQLIDGKSAAQGVWIRRKDWPLALRGEILSMERRAAASNAVETRLMACLPPKGNFFFYSGGIYTREFNMNATLGPAMGVDSTLKVRGRNLRVGNTLSYPMPFQVFDGTFKRPAAILMESALELVDAHPNYSQQHVGLVTRNYLSAVNIPNFGIYFTDNF